MVSFDTFIKRWSELDKFLEKKGNEILLKDGKKMAALIVEQQKKGINSEGKKMQSGYSPGYSKRRKSKGLQTRFVDLHFSGQMHKGMKSIKVPNGVDVRSEEPYEYYVRAMFPKGFSLTKENAKEVSEMLAKKLAPEMKKYLVK